MEDHKSEGTQALHVHRHTSKTVTPPVRPYYISALEIVRNWLMYTRPMTLNWHTIVGASASITMLALIVPYVRSILNDSTRPNPVSWFGWALLYTIAAAAQASKGLDWSLAVSVIGIFSTGTIAIIAVHTGKVVWTPIDRFSIAIACLAIVFWIITGEPLVALVLSLVADLAVSVPTLYKTYLEPETEPWLLWLVYATTVALTIAATTSLTIYNLLVPIYSLGVDALITLFALRVFIKKNTLPLSTPPN